MTQVIFERLAEAPDPALYAGSEPAVAVAGFASVDDEALRRYDALGYLLVRGAISAAQVAAARDELDAMARAEDPACEAVFYEGLLRRHLAMVEDVDPGAAARRGESFVMGETANRLPALGPELRARHVRKFAGFLERHQPLRSLAEAPPLVALVARLIGEPGRIFQDMALVKPPGGREKPWHQDHAYFDLPLDTRIVGVWIPLEDATPENGCMHVLAGAHRGGPQLHFMRRDWQICDTEIAGCRQTAIPMAAGDVLLFDSKLPHGTPVNRTEATRWAVQFHFVPASARKADDGTRLAAFGSEGKDVTC
jgi:phytanoyl-CoA hydroxylase